MTLATATRTNGRKAVVPGITEETVPVEAIDLAPLSQTIMEIHIEGSTPLIVNSFGEKARREMLAAMQVTGTTKRKSKSVRNPQIGRASCREREQVSLVPLP